MSIRNKFLLGFIVLMMILVMINESSAFLHGLNKARSEWYKQNQVNLTTVLDLQKRNVQAIAMGLASDPVIIEAYKRNDPQMIIDDKLEFWKQVRKDQLVYEIHFFRPPAVSFVNFSDFTTLGRDVGRVRSDITWVTSTFKNSEHLMMCKTYAGVRATYPVVDENGTMLGGLSLGKKVDWIPALLKKLTGHDAFLVYTASSAKNLAEPYYDEFLKDKELVGGYIFADRTLGLPDDVKKQVDFTQQSQRIVIDGRRYILNVFELHDFNEQVISYVGVLNDMEPFYDALIKRVGTDMILILGIMLLIYMLFRRYVDRLIGRVAEMKGLTQSFKNNRFDMLESYVEGDVREVQADEIESLQSDIVQMGRALRDSRERLEERVAEKTRALNEANALLEHRLYTDVLTALPNRNAFFRDVARLQSGALALIDINGFKRINDLYGTEIGNEVLCSVAFFCARKGNEQGLLAYRFGSDEFALIPKKPLDPRAFEAKINALVAEAESQAFFVGKEKIGIYVDLSAGISFEAAHLAETADMALNEAQQQHKNHLVYSKEMGLIERNEASIALTEQIKNAIAEDRVIPYYQPIFDAAGNLVKHECLMRIVENGRVITPYHFLEFAKKTRYYKILSRIVLEKSFAAFTECVCPFSINVTVDDILDPETVGMLQSLLENFPKRRRVVIEIVETESILNFEEVQAFVASAREQGALIAIDDFGSGYSNFSNILKLAPDYLKIDGSLIRNIHEDANAFGIVKTIVAFARELNIRTVAEFVHNEAVFECCKSLGIDEFQGYHLSEPLPEPDKGEA